MPAVHMNEWTPIGGAALTAPLLFLDLLNGVTAELWLHNFNEFCCVGVCKYNPGYFYPDYSHLLSLSSGAAAPTDSEVKFHPLVCFCSHSERDGEIDLHGSKNSMYFPGRDLKVFTHKYVLI